MPKLSPKLELTAEQKKVIAGIREQVKRDLPEIIAEGRRVKAAEDVAAVKLHAAFTLLKALRQSQHVSLTDLANKTGISKGALSRLENVSSPNVTLNTLQRVATALGYQLQISVTAAPIFEKAELDPVNPELLEQPTAVQKPRFAAKDAAAKQPVKAPVSKKSDIKGAKRRKVKIVEHSKSKDTKPLLDVASGR